VRTSGDIKDTCLHMCVAVSLQWRACINIPLN